MNYKIIPTPPFEKELKRLSKKYKSIKPDLISLSNKLLSNPMLGVALGNNCYKIRMTISSKSKGKSAGARIITHIKIVDEEIFLLAIYDKSEAENISDN